MIFETRVNGIPCQCKVTAYTPGVPAKLLGPPENCYEAQPEEFEFEILDRRGRYANWLKRYISPEVVDRLAEEHHDMVAGEYYEAFED